MDLFKLQADINIEIDKAVQSLNILGAKANEIAERVQNGVAKDTDVNITTNKAVNQLTKLNTTIQRQETELELLKNKYKDVYLAQGKSSEEAKDLAKQIDTLSKELKENKSKLDDASKAADKLDKNFDDVEKSSKKVGDGFTVLKGAAANLIAQGFTKLLQVGSQLLGGAAQYQSSLEQYTTSFEVMTGSAEKAASITKELGDIAANTPFELPTLADTTQLLMNYGFQADDAMAKMMMLGDISQGSADKMNRIAMAYGQMSSAGKVSLEDVKQMIEAGFNPLQEISQTTGESMASLYDRISKGTISVDEITESMKRSTSEGGKYFGSMDKQSQTLEGRLSTLKDTVNASLGQALLPILQTLADDVLPKVTAYMETINWEEVGQKLGEIFLKVLDFGTWLIQNIETIGTVVGIIAGIVATLKIFNAVMAITNAIMLASPVTWIVLGIVAAVAALIAIIVLCVKHWDKIKETATAVWQAIKDAWNSAANWFNTKVVQPIVNFFTGLWNGIKTGATNVWNAVVNTFNKIKNSITSTIEAAKNKVKETIDKIKSFFNITLSFLGIKVPKVAIEWSQAPKWMAEAAKFLGMKGVPKFNVSWNAEGAIFKQPTVFATPNGFQGVGEAGAEAVLPIDKLQGYVSNAIRSENSGLEYQMSRVYTILANFFPQIIEEMDRDIVLDTGALVGHMAKEMDTKLGTIYERKGRGR